METVEEEKEGAPEEPRQIRPVLKRYLTPS
jgi:hypothetical protein